MKRIVLDSSALSAFFENKAGADVVEECIGHALAGKQELTVTVASLSEFYRAVCCSRGREVARYVLAKIHQLPIKVVDVDQQLAIGAAESFAFSELSFAEATAAALSKLRRATLATTNAKFEGLGEDIRVLMVTRNDK